MQFKRQLSRIGSLGRWIIVIAAALAVFPLAIFSDAAHADASCTVEYDIVNQWGDGYQANVTVINNTTSPIQGWDLTWTFGPGEGFSSGWNASFNPSGSTMSASNVASHWNGTIGANGGAVSFGMIGSHSGTVSTPTDFAVNGVACGEDVPPTDVPPTDVPPTDVPPTDVPPTDVPPTDVPPTDVPPTDVPPTDVPPTDVPPTDVPPTATPTSVPPTDVPPTDVPPTATPSGSGSCQVEYTIVNDWGNGFQADVLITNTSSSVIDGYTLTWDYANGEQATSGWNVSLSQSGTTVSASNAAGSWNGMLAANGGTSSFGFQGNHSGTLAVPGAFYLNGELCGGGVEPTATPLPTSSPTPGPSPTPSPTVPPPPQPVFRVNTQGQVTKDGEVFPIQCGSWFGLEGRHEPSSDPVNPSGAALELYIGNTIWANGGQGTGRTIQDTMDEIKALGINVIRFPIVPQTLDPNDPQGLAPNLKNHPSVQVPNARQAMEEFLILADQNDLEVMLDVHSCSNYVGWRAGRLDARPPYVDADRDDYDYPREEYSCAATNNPDSVQVAHPYDEEQWLADLQDLAGLSYELGIDNIIGIDIFNEPWDYTWDEWKTLTEKAYVAIDEVNPNILLFVQGISATAGNQDGTPDSIVQVPHGDEATNPNWGENLYEAISDPIDMPRDRLVFSPHTYGPSVFVQRGFMDPAQPECEGLEGDAAGDADCNIVLNETMLRQGWEEHFGYLEDLGYAVVVGEFGGNMDWPLGIASTRDRNRWSHIEPGIDQEWQEIFVDYMADEGIEGCYWSINPESGDTGGIYQTTYHPINNSEGWGEWLDFDMRKVNLLLQLWGTN